MIALQILHLRWADPKSRKLLIHDDTRPAERFAGDDGEGFYDARRAIAEWQGDTPLWWQSAYSRQLECGVSNLHLYGICQDEHSALYAVYIEHFSAPTDADDLFVETPLLSLPDAVEDTPEAVYDPDTRVWSVGDWFMVTSEFLGAGDVEFTEKYGRGPFQVTDMGKGASCPGSILSHGAYEDFGSRLWYPSEIRPCPPPTQETPLITLPDVPQNRVCPACNYMLQEMSPGEWYCIKHNCGAWRAPRTQDTQSGPVCTTEPVPVHASPQQTLRGQEMPREHLGGLRPLD